MRSRMVLRNELPSVKTVQVDDGRASWSPDLIETIRHHYRLSRIDVEEDLGGGYNLNLLVQTEQGRLVVRVYQPWMPGPRLAAIQQVRQYLGARGWPVASSRPTVDGRGFVYVGQRPIEVEGYIPGGSPMNTWPALCAGMAYFARLHDTLANVPVTPATADPPLANHVPAGDVVEVAESAGQSIISWDLTDAEQRYLHAAMRLAEQLAARETFDVPSQLVHGDFWDNNVFLDEDRLALLADFDFVGVRPRIDDLALTLFFANEQAGRQDRSAARVARLRRLVDAYDVALERPLDGEERADLPYAIARSPLTFLRDMAVNGAAGRAELARLRGPEYEWALEILDSPVWLEGFL